MAASHRAPIAPDVLRWARETAGVTIDDAAPRIGVAADRLRSVEAGDGQLTLNQARDAAGIYGRPFAVLFLPEPPTEEPFEVQFRRFRDAPSLPWPRKMRTLGRRVPALQDEAEALFEALDEPPRWREALEIFQQQQNDPFRLGGAIRSLVGVSIADQKTAARIDPQGFKVFRLWREALEELGVLVLQDGSLELEEMRGFAAPHERVPAIVINTHDDIRARLFTMLHEFAHVLSPLPDERRSDEFAGEILMPRNAFSEDFRNTTGPALLDVIDSLARLYGVTPDATAVRTGWLELVDWDRVNAVRAQIRERGGFGSRGPGGDHYRNVVARMGPGFVTRVLGAVADGAVTELGAARLLDVRVEKLPAVRKALGGDFA